MTKREAKRLACWHVGVLIDTALGAGWEVGVADEEVKTEKDAEMLTECLCEIEQEMYRRGWRRQAQT